VLLYLRNIGWGLGFLLLGTLSSCGYKLDTKQVAVDIEADIERQGRRILVKSVECPNDVQRKSGGYFRCTGELEPEGSFTVDVQQSDSEGNVQWDIPQSKALLNIVKLETDLQATLGREFGVRPKLDCGETYRVNSPGESFECDVIGRVSIGSDQLEGILVRVDQQRNLTWQEIRQAAGSASPATPSSASADGEAKASPSGGASSTSGQKDSDQKSGESEEKDGKKSPPESLKRTLEDEENYISDDD